MIWKSCCGIFSQKYVDDATRFFFQIYFDQNYYSDKNAIEKSRETGKVNL